MGCLNLVLVKPVCSYFIFFITSSTCICINNTFEYTNSIVYNIVTVVGETSITATLPILVYSPKLTY